MHALAPSQTTLPRIGTPTYDAAVTVFNDWLGGRKATEETVRLFFQDLRSGRIKSKTGRPYAPKTIHTYRAALKRSIRASFGPGATVELVQRLDAFFKENREARPENKVRKDKILTPAEVRKLKEQTSPRLAALVGFLVVSGLRISEALALRSTDLRTVGEGQVQVHVRFGKRSKERFVLVPLRTVQQVKAVFTSRDYLFAAQSGEPLSRQYVHRELRKEGLRIIGREIGCHTFRHTHATTCIKTGMSLKAAADRLGHANTATTSQMYIHDEASNEDVEKLAREFD